VLTSVELYTQMHVMLGTLDTGRLRTSDYVNGAGVDMVPLVEAWIGDLARRDAAPVWLKPAAFHKRDILLVVPGDHLEPVAQLRPGFVRTRTVRVAVSIGPFLVQGDVHVPPGVQFEIRRLFGAEARTFMPLTSATLTYTPNPNVDAQHHVVLVRADHVEFAGLAHDANEESPPALASAVQDRLRALVGGSG